MPTVINFTHLPALAILLSGAALLVVFSLLIRRGFRPALRHLSAYSALHKQVGEALESGRRVHIGVGSGSAYREDAAATLAGLAVLGEVAQLSAITDLPPVATTSDASVLPLLSGTISQVARDAGAAASSAPEDARMVAFDPLAMAGALTSVISDDRVHTSILVGSFGAEAALIAEAGARSQIEQMAGSDRLEGQAVACVAVDHPLLGEEIFVARAYLSGSRSAFSAVLVQDVLRWLLAAAIVIGSLLSLAGLLR
ncbi:MAG: hypothetical protein IT326_03535 [Anaerolineae bacterium]|nr:hypothetical protein [Anaerolineae bacterium]